ncbi:MAG: hypothetical protein V8T35_00375 [Prevotella sp.]
MKRFQLFSLASAMLLASAAGFTSCSSDSEDPLDGGSGVAGQVVKTQFYLNIPYAGNDEGGNARVSTRMSDENTQNKNNFLGLVDLEMFAFGEDPTSEATSTRTIRIGNNLGNYDTENKRRLYSDIAIPVGTTHMVLYTRASKKDNSTPNTNKTNFEAGSLTDIYTKFTDEAKPKLSEISFNLETIHSANDFDTQGKTILDVLNSIAQTQASINNTPIEWSKISEANIGTQGEREILQNLYNNFVKLEAGSEASVIRAIEDLKAAVNTQKLVDFTALTNNIEKNCTTKGLSSVNGFPRGIGLPDGAAVLEFNSDSKEFAYKEVTTGIPTGGNLVDHKTITYPSELAYFVSSPVATSSTKDKLADLPDYNAWLKNNEETWKEKEYEGVVKSNTKLVVLKNPVQYGVACLKSKITCATTLLEDNAKNFKFAANNTLTVPTNGIEVKGILIGGQPQGVEWNFEPASSATFDHTIYDRDMNNGIAAKISESKPNYTLVLDNRNSSTTAPGQSKVYVTVELENNMGDFYGAEGLIPKDTRFYLVGQLDLNAPTGVTKPSETLDHVFIKDHTTVANFKITNLKKAYNHIPDMRTSKINVGLAVDLSWQEGITFNVDL